MNKKIDVIIPKELLKTGLTPNEITIIGYIDSYEKLGLPCFPTNDYLAYLFGSSRNTIDRTLKKLESKNLIKREIKTIMFDDNGRKNRYRCLSIDVDGYKKLIESCAKNTEYIK